MKLNCSCLKLNAQSNKIKRRTYRQGSDGEMMKSIADDDMN